MHDVLDRVREEKKAKQDKGELEEEEVQATKTEEEKRRERQEKRLKRRAEIAEKAKDCMTDRPPLPGLAADYERQTTRAMTPRRSATRTGRSL